MHMRSLAHLKPSVSSLMRGKKFSWILANGSTPSVNFRLSPLVSIRELLESKEGNKHTLGNVDFESYVKAV